MASHPPFGPGSEPDESPEARARGRERPPDRHFRAGQLIVGVLLLALIVVVLVLLVL